MSSAVDTLVNPFAEGLLAVATSFATGAVAYATPRLKWGWFVAGIAGVAFVLAEGYDLRWRVAGILITVAVPMIIGPLWRVPLSRFAARGLLAAGVLAVAYSGWLEFFGPAFSRGTLRGLTTVMNHGVCLQTTSFTCGPAAVVTLLRKLGIPAEEGELAVLAKASFHTGTDAALLCDAVNRRYRNEGVHATPTNLQTLAELEAAAPCATVTYYDFTTDHWVAVLAVQDGKVELGDPISGKRTVSSADFVSRWKHESLLVTR